MEIKLGPDGALYIADFYDCIIGYYEVPLTHPRRDKTRGRIWRVVYRGTGSTPHELRKQCDLTKLELDELWPRLAICHQMAGEGKKFGPDLDGIGVRGLDRLLEDLLDPSRNVDPAFQSTIVITDRGLTHTGLALRDEGEVLILVDSEGKELRIRHGEIDERYTSPLSPMPNALEKTLDTEAFNHLLRYLLEAKD